MSMPMISVIVPFWQVPPLRLRKCVSSILAQSYSDFELLLMDDGNSENWQPDLCEWLIQDDRARLIRLPHNGVSVARNVGIEYAQGEFICFVDSDDYLDRDHLFNLFQAIQGCDLAICGVCEKEYGVFEGWISRRAFLSQPNRYNFIQYTNFSVNKLYRTSILNEHNIYFPSSVKLGEDALFVLQYLEKAKSICGVSQRTYHYVPNLYSAINKPETSYWDWERQVIETINNIFHTYPLTNQQEKWMQNWLFQKIDSVINYYLDHFKHQADNRKRMLQILSDPFIKRLYLARKALSHRERIKLALWRSGLVGIHLIRVIRIVKRKLLNKQEQ